MRDPVADTPAWPRLLFDSVPYAVYVGDLAGGVIEANRAGLDRLRCTRDELRRAVAFDIVTDLTPDLYGVVKETTATGRVVTRHQVHRRRDGARYRCSVDLRRISIEGRPLILITERPPGATEESLETGDGALPTGWQADAVVAVDGHGSVAVFGEGAERVFRVARAAVFGRSFEACCTPALATALGEEMRRRAPGLPPRPPFRTEARRASGERFPAEVVLRHLEAAGVPLVAVLLRDLSQQPSPCADLGAGVSAWTEVEPACLAALVGRSPVMTRLRAVVRAAAAASATVLVQGETGTGKELVARALHELSPRRAGPQVTVNSAALPPGLIDSELFGHERGAFTDAAARKIGRFESAHGGTLFLDEIGDLPLDLQAKLLRVLQERRLMRLGGERPIDLDVRVVAATNRNLRAEVGAGRFRADLFYRLNVLPIVTPPLRDRRDDIPDLVQHFVRLHGAGDAGAASPFDARALSWMATQEWPGNVRELQNVVERTLILSRQREVTGLPELIDGWGPEPMSPPPAADASPSERDRILAALERTGWRVSGEHGCARLLGLRPTTLVSRMKRLGIRRPRL